MRATGTVNVRVLIDPNGKALKTCTVILPGEPEVDKSLIEAALANVKQWNFLPLKNRSHALRQTTIQVKFTLADNSVTATETPFP
jgi:TonB family protein